MIHYVRHKDIDTEKWNACIWASPNGLVYAFSWYLDIVAEEWDALIEDDYVSVFPLPVKRKYNIVYAYQPFWTQQLGLFSKILITPEKSLSFLQQIPSHFRYIDFNLNSLQKLPDAHSYSLISNDNYQLDLIYSYELLYTRYSQNLKRNLKNTHEGYYIHMNPNPEALVDLFKQNRGKDINTLKENDYKKLLHLLYYARNINIANIWGMYNASNSLIAGLVFMIAKGRAILLFSATSQLGREAKSMHTLIDAFIQKHQEHNLVLDFEGSNDPKLARFYKSFGAENVPYTRIRYTNLPLPLDTVTKLKNWLRR